MQPHLSPHYSPPSQPPSPVMGYGDYYEILKVNRDARMRSSAGSMTSTVTIPISLIASARKMVMRMLGII
ncbi:quinolinate synthetase [Sesbania bispinosa]|nr:quinolinate synthetase [Sesbania bispinosa]